MSLIKVLDTDSVITKSTRVSRNQHNKWRYGYDAEFDIVVISKDGTVGSVVEIQGLKIGIPTRPSKHDIMFNKRSRKDQMWRKQPIPRITPDNESDYKEYIEQEFTRRINGAWFYNNGTPIYITGSHYFMLQHAKIKSTIGEPEYRDPNRAIFYFWEACKADERCYGMVFLKARRLGFSTIGQAELVNNATITEDGLFAIISKKEKDAKSFFRKSVNMFRNLIHPFKPMVDGSTNPQSELNFSEPAQRISKNNKVIAPNGGLNTRMNFEATSENSYDGEEVTMAVLDEIGKFPTGVSFAEFWANFKPTLEVGDDIVGKALAGSTANDLNKGGQAFKDCYYGSDIFQRDGNGRTKTGLYRMFVPASDSLQGFFDVYGNIIKDNPKTPIPTRTEGKFITQGSKSFIRKRYEGKKGADLLREKKLYPESPEDAFWDDSSDNGFNQIKIEEQRQYIQQLDRNPIIRGNFMWKNAERDTQVEWHPNEQGRFWITWMPKQELQNKHFYKNGKMFPANVEMGAGGVDTFDLDVTIDKGSDGAFHFKTKTSPLNDFPSDQFILEYIHRPPLARDFYEDVLMAAVFYGFPLLVENNKYGIVRYFEERGYDGYIMDIPKQYDKSKTRNVKKSKGIAMSSQDILDAHQEGIQWWIEKNIGETDSGDFGEMYFVRTLEDWSKFNPNKRTAFDATISSGLAIMACKSANVKRKPDVVKLALFKKGKVNAWG
jgi:hypothetical protein